MIGIGAPDVKGMWEGLNRFMFTKIDTTEYQFHRSSFRKIATSIVVRVNKWGAPGLKMSDVGYSKEKGAQLYKMYYPVEDVRRFHEIVKDNEKKTFTAAIITRGAVAKEDIVPATKGPCLQSIVIGYVKGQPKKAHIFYRVTEVTKKFYADLVFIHQILEDLVGREAMFLEVWFYLPMAYAHMKQFPVIDILIDWRSWNWDDVKMSSQIHGYLLSLKGGNLPSYGMVKRTGEWYLEQKGIPVRE